MIQDNSAIISDSWRIAEYLENNYTNQPSLFSSPTDKANEKFVSSWVDSQIHPLVAKCVMRDILDVIDPNDRTVIFSPLVRSDLECRWKKLWRIEKQ